MATKRELFEDILSNKFTIDQFTIFIREMLTGVNIISPIISREVSDSTFYNYVDSYAHLGTYKSRENENIAVFSVALKRGESVERARGVQRNFAKTLLENSNANGAIIAFYTAETPEKWRLSFVRMDYEFIQGKVSEKLTPAKRYSYLVGDKEPCNTAKQRLFPIFKDDDILPTLNDLEEAFSVDKVTKEFFDLYKIKYLELKDILDSNNDFIEEAKSCGFTSEQFAKKLIGQIAFLYFVQKKGWLGVGVWPKKLSAKKYDNLYYTPGAAGRVLKENLSKVYKKQDDEYIFLGPSALESISDDVEKTIANKLPDQKKWGDGDKDFVWSLYKWSEKKQKNFFNDFLEPLFYTTLNINRGENAYCEFLHCRVPFLNGGLFEELKGYDWKNSDFDIPNSYFSNEQDDGLLDIFKRFNFTMNEDEPMEREVAIDPEMLGKVFENLLDIKDRKSKGAYYTPREIVHYMCQETLINYLQGKLEIPYDDVKSFVLYGDLMKDEDTKRTKWITDSNGKPKCIVDKDKELFIPETIFSFKKNIDRLPEVDDLLKNIKIADLAVGSGAFPLGMLSEIVHLREVITEYQMIDMEGMHKLSFINYGRKPYQLKTETIKNCLFACDIEPSAVDIAKLRLWLSIVIEDEIADQYQNNGIVAESTRPKQLPNLDCNFICGNSLIDEFKGNELITESKILNNESVGTQQNVFQKDVDILINELIKLQDKIFFEKSHEEKMKILDNINEIYNQIILEQGIKNNPDLKEEYLEVIQKPSKPFILWQLYFPKVFKDNGGFDIVIGNPPYVGESGHKDIFRPIAATKFGDRFYQGKMDLFYFFFHKGLDILRDGGELALITTNYFPTATGAKNLRLDLKRRSKLRQMINFNEVKVFESALGQHNMITVLSKRYHEDEREIAFDGLQCLDSYVATPNQISEILHGESSRVIKTHIQQDNIFDGEEAYIRIGGVNASSNETSAESILTKMSTQSDTLEKYAEVNQGVLTGCDTLTNKHLSKLPSDTTKQKNDGIYVLDMDVERDVDVINSFSSGKELLKDFYKNSDIDKYWCSDTPTKKLIYYTGALDEEKYPDVYAHMQDFRPILEARLVTYNEKYHWTAIHRPRNGKVFEKDIPKIVVPYRTKTNAFAYNEIEWFCRSDCYVITSKNNGLEIKALLAILNTDTYYFWLYHRGKRKGEILELFQKPLSELPIKAPSTEIQHQLIHISDEIMEKKRISKAEDTSELEEEANNIVYKLFGFSADEIQLIRQAYGGNNE